jgi:hypothetical protein
MMLHSHAGKEVKRAVACSICGFNANGVVFWFLPLIAGLKGGFVATFAS